MCCFTMCESRLYGGKQKKGRWANIHQRKRKGENVEKKFGESKTNLFIIIRMHICLFISL